MYQAYWGLQRAAFTPAATRQTLTASPVHAEALARLDFLCESGSAFGLLIGPSGSGKSTLLSEFAGQAERSGRLVALANAAGGDESAVLTSLATGLQIDIDENASRQWRRITERLEELKLECLSAVVLLDDLDRAAPIARAYVEQLLALADAPLTVVAAARPQNVACLGVPLLSQASLRIDLHPWDEAETNDYLQKSLASAGRMQSAFTADGARRLFELSGGAPRKVNQLAQLALLAGAAQQLVQIDAETMEAVDEELSAAR
jgi:type II secretory pathway predicted ATPase ExeA